MTFEEEERLAHSTNCTRPKWKTDGDSDLGARSDSAAFLAVKKDTSFCRMGGVMIPIRTFFHIDKATFDARSKQGWPKLGSPRDGDRRKHQSPRQIKSPGINVDANSASASAAGC